MVSNSYKTTSLKTPIYLFKVGDDFLFDCRNKWMHHSFTSNIQLPEYDADDIKEQYFKLWIHK